MKKLYCLLAIVLLLAGCSQQTQPAAPSETGSASAWVGIDIYGVNDLHGKLLDTTAQPGVDELTTYLKSQPGNQILLATGDMWQGASESNLTGGFIVTEWMNDLGFAAMTLGGHEFDFGEEGIRQNQQLANFPFLAINIYSRQTNAPVDFCQGSVVVDIEGVQVGIIGAIGDCYYAIASQHTEDIYFKTGTELTALVKAEAERLRSQGVDFIIYALHDGAAQTTGDTKPQPVADETLVSYYDTQLSQGYVDLVFEADSHYWYLLEDAQGVCHLQSGGNNSGISHAKVLINTKTGEAQVVTTRLIPASGYSYMEDDPVVERLLEKYAEEIAPANRILGENGSYRNKNQICQLVADLYCQQGMETWGDRYDIVLGGGYISCRSPGYLPAGEVTYSQLQSLLPFDNQIMLCSIKGLDLIAKFLETDNDAYFIKTTPYGESIREDIDPNATYYVVTDSYTGQYAYNHMTVVETYDGNVFARDLLAEHIAAGNLE